MKRSHKTAAGIVAALSLGVAVAAFAQPGPIGEGNGPHGEAGMPHGGMGGMQHGAMGQGATGMGAGHPLMTPEEHTALREKMHNATPEERQKLAQSTRDEMHQRAREKGITLPQHGGPAHTH